MLVVTLASHEPLSQIICPEAAGGFYSDEIKFKVFWAVQKHRILVIAFKFVRSACM